MFRGISRNRKVLSAFGVAAVLAGLFALSTGTSQAGESCPGLDTALRNNLQFIAGQQQNPDANSAARIANRQAVVDLIQQRRQAAGCTGDPAAESPPAGAAPPAGAPPTTSPPAPAPPAGAPPANAAPPPANAAPPAGGGEVVCSGSTVTLSGEGGAPAASSGQFPVGTRLRVTNRDNNKSTTVAVTSGSGSCVLLNNAAFEQIREPNKFLIRRALIERVG